MAVQKQDDQHRTYIQQLCEDTGCCPEDLPEAMNDREKWRERIQHDMMMMMNTDFFENDYLVCLGFYGISTIAGYLMQNQLYTY